MKLTPLGTDCHDLKRCATIVDGEALVTMNLSTGEGAVELPEALVRKVWGDAD